MRSTARCSMRTAPLVREVMRLACGVGRCRRSESLMSVEVRFDPVRAATRDAGEDGYLVYADQQLVALLVPADTGWFLQSVSGPVRRKALIFGRLREAEAWVRACLSGLRGSSSRDWLTRQALSPFRAEPRDARSGSPTQLGDGCGSCRRSSAAGCAPSRR